MGGKLTARIRAALRQRNGVRVITVLGLAGMALILLSGLHSGSDEKKPAEALTESVTPLNSADLYRTDLETRLSALLSRMDGVGGVTVMLTVSGSAEQIYAEEVKETDSDRASQRESSLVITKSGGAESALLTETRYPHVTGAAVLCTGGAHAAVRERVTQAVSTVLQIPANQIYVGTGI